MDVSGTCLFTHILVSFLVRSCDSQTLALCDTPEKDAYCILECKTRDLNQPVSFLHPRTKDVGSCGSNNKCSSAYKYYTLSQSTSNGYITRFHIAKLDRQRDEGDWACAYGNVASNTMNLTVHSRPNEVDINIRQSAESDKTYEINCTCGCLYPLNAVSLHLILTNQENEIERELGNLQDLDSSLSECTGNDRTLYGSLKIDRENWRGKSVDIVCLCKELKLRHTIKRRISYNFLGRPDEVTITVNQSQKKEKVYNIGCTCSCIYKDHDVEMKIILSYKEREIEQESVTVKTLDRSACTKDERAVAGSMDIKRTNWQGSSLDIQCICTDSKIGFTTKKKISYVFTGIPDRPLKFQLISRFSNYLEVKWEKGFDGGLKQTFIIEYTSTKGDLVTVAKQDDGILTEISMKVTGLTPNTPYELWLYAENAKGRSSKISLKDTTTEEIKIPVLVKIIIPLICFIGGFICFTALIYYCLYFAFLRKMKTYGFIAHEYQVLRSTMKRKSMKIFYAVLGVIGVLISFVVAFTMAFDDVISTYAAYIIGISLAIGFIGAIVYNGVLWARLIIDYKNHRNYIRRNIGKGVVDNMELTIGFSSNKLTANSLFLIMQQVNDGTFVKTKGYQEGWRKSLQYGAVMYTGAIGDGRTTNAYHIMYKWATEYKHIPIILSDVRKWEKVITAKEKFVVLIESIVSNTVRSNMTDEEITAYFRMMLTYVVHGKTKLIMTEQTNRVNDHQLQFQHIELFDKRFRVDLCQRRYRFTRDEKELILLNHCELNNIEICEAKSDENILERKPLEMSAEKRKAVPLRNIFWKKTETQHEERNEKEEQQSLICDTDVPIKISRSTVDDIIGTDPPLGYPESCASFCKNEEYRKLGLEFFLRTSEKIVDQIESLYLSEDAQHALEYEVLKTLFKEDGKTKFPEKKYGPALQSLKGVYIAQDEDNEYIFTNNSVYVAVGLAIGKKDPKSVIEQCDWNFLRHYSKLDRDLYDKNITYLHITPDHYEIVKSKFLKDLPKGSVNRTFDYISRLGEDVLCETLDEVQNNTELDQIVRESCKKERGVFVYACEQENANLMKELWNRYEKSIPKKMLKDMKTIAKDDSIRELLTQWIGEKISA